MLLKNEIDNYNKNHTNVTDFTSNDKSENVNDNEYASKTSIKNENNSKINKSDAKIVSSECTETDSCDTKNNKFKVKKCDNNLKVQKSHQPTTHTASTISFSTNSVF